MKRLLITLVALALGMTAFAQYGPGHYGRPGYGYGPGYGSGHRPGPGVGYMQDGVFEFGVTLNHFTTRERARSRMTPPISTETTCGSGREHRSS